MALYHEAATILETARKNNESLKSLVYSNKAWKSDQKTLFALTTQAAKWSEVLSEIIEKSGVLKVEKQLTPILALVLAHDLFLSKKGVALPQSHGLHASIARHKVRLSAELTKVRLKKGFGTLDGLRASIEAGANGTDGPSELSNGSKTSCRPPRWVRINTLKTTLAKQLATTFADYARTPSLKDLMAPASNGNAERLHIDEHIPNLIAVSSAVSITTSKAYVEGKVILQDKASCFPAYLLDPGQAGDGDVIDACAAPGNKTTHLAAILHDQGNGDGRIIACEKDPGRSQTLEKMVSLADGNEIITVKSKQDFMKLDPDAREFKNVTGLLLDPSCSGSGILGRDEGGITVHLPRVSALETALKGKKRKRTTPQPPSAVEGASEEMQTEDIGEKLQTRLANLSAFQLRLLQRAMAFPAATKITYSTCSVHVEENEHVVVKALLSKVAKARGWRVVRRDEQVEGMMKWHRRGWPDGCQNVKSDEEECDRTVDVTEVADACIRCVKGSEDGTMGFFVAGFVRQPTTQNGTARGMANGHNENEGSAGDEETSEDEWNGFDDED